jgi:hypothetical protein
MNTTKENGMANETVTVPVFREDGGEGSYPVELTPEQAAAALARAVAELRAERVGNDEWRYRDDNKFACAVTRLDLITLGAGLLDERGVDYGVWCNYHGHVIEEKSEK